MVDTDDVKAVGHSPLPNNFYKPLNDSRLTE